MDKQPDVELFELFKEFSMHTVQRLGKFNTLMGTYGITYPEYRILNFLSVNVKDNEISKIADGLCILRQTMTHLTDSLQKKGYVERVPHPHDRRSILIKLTPTGAACIAFANELTRKLFTSIVNKFPQDELYHFFDIQLRIKQDINSEISAV